MDKLRQFLASTGGKTTALVLGLIGLVVLIWAVKGSFGQSEAGALSADRTFIDASTKKPFEYTIKEGDTIPVKAPSGGMTGYPAELCYWTKDGKTKQDPTPVLLNEVTGKPGPTFCPDCGRLVVGHNPAPAEGMRPPPTQAEYKPRGGGRAR